MKSLFLIVSLFVASIVSAKSHIGETAPNLCWTNEKSERLCMDDFKDQVRVLLYNGGFCGPCNSEFEELVPQVSSFNGKPVQFLSLSVAGWTGTSKPTPQFLQEWKQKHSIPFPVLASSRQELYGFITNGKLPSVVIVDQKGQIALAEINPGINATFKKINELLK